MGRADMLREEREVLRNEKKKDQKEYLEMVDVEANSMRDYTEELRKKKQIEDLSASKDFQEAKRCISSIERYEELERIHEQYLETREDSETRVEMRKAALLEEQRRPVEDNLENYRTVAEYA